VRHARRALLAMGLLGIALAGCSSPSLAAGAVVGVDLVDRDTGQVLEVYRHRGRQYVAGRPGARYAIRITNRSGERILAVTAVDGINIVTGQTASWEQTGYVLAPWQSCELTGWRKSDEQVAAFEFTALPDSYAARTGRPLDVGVIGVAVFRERPPPLVQAPWAAARGRSEAQRGSAAGSGRTDGAAAPAAPSPQAATEAYDESEAVARSRLGTGHGGREVSRVRHTAFERASSAPVQIVSIQYDRWENLVAAGIAPGRRHGEPRPFPGTPDGLRYVPDPPGY
jgi:hypothetical protein